MALKRGILSKRRCCGFVRQQRNLRSRPSRPRVEQLEDRVVPSNFIEVEPNNTPTEADLANVVSVPVGNILTAQANDWLNISGAIASGSDVDYFRFTLANPSGVFFDIDSRETGLSTSLDSIVTVFDVSGTSVLGSNDNGYDFDTGYPAPALQAGTSPAFDSSLYLDLNGGTYYVRVSSLDATTGTYWLRLLADPNYSSVVPVFQSNPGAADTLFLDFDGHAAPASAPDRFGTYTIPAFDFNGNGAVFTPAEKLAIKNVWRTVAEDYSPFAINITTSYAGSFSNGVGFRQVIGNSNGSEVGQPSSVLGEAYLNSYASGTDSIPGGLSDNVAFTFALSFSTFGGGISGQVAAKPVELGNTCAHEFGHALGLRHYGGTNPQPNGIMHVPDDGLNSEIWRTGATHSGESPIVFQDDMAVISSATNTFGYRPDDHPDTRTSATALTSTSGVYTVSGIISDLTKPDLDFFRFDAGGPTTVTVSVDDYINDLDVEIRLYDASGTLVAAHDPSNSFDAFLSMTLPVGTYYLEVRSDGEPGEAGQYDVRIVTAPPSGIVQFSAATYSVAENGGAATITVSRIGSSAGTVTVTYATSNGSATAGQDYIAAAGTLTFANGEVSKTFFVVLLDDKLDEGNETVNLTLSNPTNGATLGLPSTAVLTIVDDESVPLLKRFDFGTATSPIAAGYTQVTPATTYTTALGYGWQSSILAVDRGTGTDLTRDLNYTPSGTFAVDLSPGTYTVTLMVGDLGHLHDLMQIRLEGAVVDTLSTAAGQVLTKSYTVTVSDGQLNLRLQDLGGADPNVVLMGLDLVPGTTPLPPPAGNLQFSAATYTVTENGGSVTITVSRSGGNAGTVSVSYATSNGSASAGQDYTGTSGTLTFQNGEVSKTFLVAILDDKLDEGNETVNLTLSNPTSGATLGLPSTAVLTIVDDEPAPLLKRFDFGTDTSPVAAGYTQVTPVTTYTAALGYGWQSGTLLAVDRGTGTDLTRDLNFTPLGTFAVNLSPGTYTVTLTVGDLGHLHDLMQIRLEGGVVDTLSTAAGQVLTKSYTVSVTDGQLTLHLQDLGGSDPNTVLIGLEMVPGTPPPGSPPGFVPIGTPGDEPVAPGVVAVEQHRPAPGIGAAKFDSPKELSPEVVDRVFVSRMRRQPALRPAAGLVADLLEDAFALLAV